MNQDEDESRDSDRLDGHPHPRATMGLVGQGRGEAELLDAYRAGRLPHAWLIGGPEGIGKATLAWRFVRFLLAHPDPGHDAVRRAVDLAVAPAHPVAAAVAAGAIGDVAVLRREWNERSGRFYSETRVEDVRRASALFQQSARGGGYRVCIIDPVEDLNRAGANALLKLIEEPPPRSLFLLVAHRPARILPTLRSRCRLLMLAPLAPAEVARAVAALGAPWNAVEPTALAEAARRGGGSVRGALHWLAGERLALDREVGALLDALPRIDARALHGLADRIGGEPEAFETLVGSVLDWLHARMRGVAADGAAPGRRLAPLAEVWDKVRRSAREAESLNLDKRATLLSIFADLAQATRVG